MRNKIILIVTVASLTACSIPKSRQEMLGSVTPITTVCSQNYSPADALQRLQTAWSTCFVRPPGIAIAQTGNLPVVYPQSRVKLEIAKEDSTTVLIARLAEVTGMPTPLSNSVLLMADLQGTTQCRTEIVVRAATSHWEKRAKHTEHWLEAPTVMPAEAACNN